MLDRVDFRSVTILEVNLDDVIPYPLFRGIKAGIGKGSLYDLPLLFGGDGRGGSRLLWGNVSECSRFYLDEGENASAFGDNVDLSVARDEIPPSDTVSVKS